MSREFSKELFEANGFVVVCSDFEDAIATVSGSFGGEVHIFPRPFKEQKDLLVEDVAELQERAYMTSERERLFILKSENYSAVVQNKLLKLLEEPPAGVKFCLLVNQKAALLPTVRSRLMECHIRKKREPSGDKIEIGRLGLAGIFELLKKSEEMDKEEAKELLYRLLDSYGRLQTQTTTPYSNLLILEAFERSFRLLSLNTPPRVVFAYLLTQLTKK